MAGVNPRGDSPRDRGQIILVAAFALAVAFVALSVVINGAIFTQNLATRGDTAGGADAVQYRQQTERMAGDLLEHANANYSSTGTIGQEFENATRSLSNVSGYQQSASGRAVNFTNRTASVGGKLSNGTGDFNASGSTVTGDNWVVADDVHDTRQFHINITEPDELNATTNNPFSVVLTNFTTGNTWSMDIGYDGSSTVTVETTNASGVTMTCSQSGIGPTEPVSVNVTDGLLAGKPCEALDYADGLNATYRMDYFSSTAIRGKYSVKLNTSPSNIAPFSDPSAEEIIYSATLRYVYRTATLDYETDIRVAPGEPDG